MPGRFLPSTSFNSIIIVEAKEAIDPIIDLVEKLGYKKRLCQIKTIMATYHAYVEENFPAAFQAFEEALTIAEEVKDIVTSYFSKLLVRS